MTTRPALDVSPMPAYVFGARGLMWSGTVGLLAIEGTMFAVLTVAYFYLRLYVHEWPPHIPPPDLFYGAVNTLVLLVSAAPNEWVKRAAKRQELRTVRAGLLVCLAFAAAFLPLELSNSGPCIVGGIPTPMGRRCGPLWVFIPFTWSLICWTPLSSRH